METPIITFDKATKDRVISTLGLSINSEGKLMDEKGKIITDQDYESLSIEEFGGILRGSKIPIKNDKSSLIRYFIESID